jgi:hypothetical protein
MNYFHKGVVEGYETVHLWERAMLEALITVKATTSLSDFHLKYIMKGTLMQTPDPKKSRLNLPKKLPEGELPGNIPVEVLTEAYARAMCALPDILEDIADSLSVISLYYEKKGIQEGLLTEEDLHASDEPGDQGILH